MSGGLGNFKDFIRLNSNTINVSNVLSVEGQTNLNKVVISGDLEVEGNIVNNSTKLDLADLDNLNVKNEINVGGQSNLLSELIVDGTATFNNNVIVSQEVTVSGSIEASGALGGGA